MDFSSLLTSLGTSFIIFIFLVLGFSWLSRRPGNRVIYFPNRILKGLDASKSRYPFAWIVEASQATEDDIISMAGLDAAVYLRFFTTALIIMILSGGVCLLVLIPLSVTDINYRTTMEQAKNKTLASYDDFDKLAMGNIQQESKRLWAFVVAAYWVSVVTYIVLWKTYKHVLQLRAREQTSLEFKPEQFAILVRDIPPVPAGKTRREQVDSFFGRLYPETFERSLIVTDMSQNKKLPEDLDHPQQIDLDHDVGSNAGMEDDAHDDTDTYDIDSISNVDDDDDDHDDHDHDCDDDVEAVAGRRQWHS